MGCETTERAKVYGGWIVKVAIYNTKNKDAVSMIFVADEHHLWTIDDE
jgi:hypothetical protein